MIYDFQLSSCCGSVYNLADAEISGIEFDVTAALSDAWTLTAALAFNDAKTKGDYVLPGNQGTPVPDGTELPNVPDVKGNVRLRYDFEMGSFDFTAITPEIGISQVVD